MAKASTFTQADARPRIHFRVTADNQPQVAAIGCGPWFNVSDLPEGIDRIGGEGAWERPAVIIWEGKPHV